MNFKISVILCSFFILSCTAADLNCTQDHEHYVDCYNGLCQPKICEELYEFSSCPEAKPCKGGCLCDDYYLRNSEGICIPMNGCPKRCFLEHEHYTSCYHGQCRAKTCDELGASIGCPSLWGCEGGCICEYGYVRNSKGKCVLKSECETCNKDPNAMSGCGHYCGPRCTDDNATTTIENECPTTCEQEACICRKGYYFDDIIRKCVLPEDCRKIQCAENEFYSSCVKGEFRAKTCEELGTPAVYSEVPSPCDEGCVCKYNYVRDSKGVCIPVKECPLCGDDPNATGGCGNHCGKSCSDHNKNGTVCQQYCVTDGCDCKPGFVYDEGIKKCVTPESCK